MPRQEKNLAVLDHTGPGEFGSSSWPGDMYLRGGATTWMPGTYDPELNTIYWGTSNPAPDFDGGPRPGDDLYTDCVLALDPDTGKLKWYFQFTPHDLYDYDATETPCLSMGDTTVTAKTSGRSESQWLCLRSGSHERQVSFGNSVCEEAELGKGHRFASARPIRTGVQPTAEGTPVCPDMTGATNWFLAFVQSRRRTCCISWRSRTAICIS